MKWECAHCSKPIYWDFSTDRYRHEGTQSPYCEDGNGFAEMKERSWIRPTG